MTARIVVLVSGSGRNLQALIDACASGRIQGRIEAVISNRTDAYALTRAEVAGIPARVLEHRLYASREAFDAALAELVDAFRPDLVVLAGYMRILTTAFVQHYEGRLMNIHPSLLPRHPGLDTHQRVIDAGDAEHGATVHFVTPELDGGPRIIQGQFKRCPEDTAHSLAERVIDQIECRIYPQAVAWFAAGRLRMVNGKPELDGRALEFPCGLESLEAEFR